MSDTLKMMIENQINTYTEKYAKKHHITLEEARKTMMVRIAEEYYNKNGGTQYAQN